jgi:DNA-binding beta-propeller fold protein YncE
VAISAVNSELFWTIDQENGLIFKVDKGVGEITQFKNKHYKQFPSLVGMCALPGGKMLFSDSFLNKIFVFEKGKSRLISLNDSLTFERPTGIAYSMLTHEIWVLETTANRITVMNEQGKFIRRLGNRGAEPGEFNFPTSIWIDNTGIVYIVDALNFRVQIFSQEGKVLRVFGKNGDAAGNFARPKGIATDSYGNIYVADALFNVVQIFDSSGHFLYRFGKQGQKNGEFWMPSGIYIDEKDFIYIADSYNSRVQVFKLNATGGQE